MQAIKALVLTFLASTVFAPSAAAEVQLTIHDGRVSLIATDATVRQILTEWARVGQTKLVNVERITGAPVTLQLTNVTEEEALDVLLRSTSGYMVAPRQAMVSNVSRFDRIIVMPPSVAPRTVPAAPAPNPVFQPPSFPQAGFPGNGQPGQGGGTLTPGLPNQGVPDDDSDDGRTAPPVPVPPNRGPVFTFPQPQILPQGVAPIPNVGGGVPVVPRQPPPATGQQPATATPYPTAPSAPAGGVARPGMIVPAPQSAQPGAPQPPNGPEGQ